MANTYNVCNKLQAIADAITQGGGGGSDQAIDINYDNTTSGLTADNVQDAIDENADSIDTLNSKMAKYTLLWTNPSPSAAFAAQDIVVDISGYDDIYIETTEGVCIGKVGNGTYEVACGLSSGIAYLYYRQFALNNTSKISVGDGKQTKVTDGATSTVNALYVPLRIYGVKIG